MIARPFFEKQGLCVVREQTVLPQEVTLRIFAMEKLLSAGAHFSKLGQEVSRSGLRELEEVLDVPLLRFGHALQLVGTSLGPLFFIAGQ